MNYDSIETNGDILAAFQQCKNAGEHIDLFEGLARRNQPPIAAFEELIHKTKLEPVLALAIQALGWVENPSVLAQLQADEDLLKLLSQKARTGATDLIKWSAARTIGAIGFEFNTILTHLHEPPNRIIESMVTQRVNDLKRVDLRIDPTNTKGESIDFWIYGDTHRLRCETFQIDIDVDYSSEREIAERFIVRMVIGSKAIRAIKENNYYLHQAFTHSPDVDEFDRDNFYQNSIFTLIGQETSAKLLQSDSGSLSNKDLQVAITNQIYCLNSKDLKVRELAANFLDGYQPPVDRQISQNILTAIEQSNQITNGIRSATDDLEEDQQEIDRLNLNGEKFVPTELTRYSFFRALTSKDSSFAGLIYVILGLLLSIAIFGSSVIKGDLVRYIAIALFLLTILVWVGRATISYLAIEQKYQRRLKEQQIRQQELATVEQLQDRIHTLDRDIKEQTNARGKLWQHL